ncbi:hypothetical protein J6590_016103 [Homalodisca vitripennis]|nr:hypothetical protein J6590_016103 [Homalodisca vitripennis]
MDFEWSRECIETLVNAYRVRTELWDPKDNKYHIKNKKMTPGVKLPVRWVVIMERRNRKLSSLLSSFRREKAKEKKTKNSTGSGRDQLYVSTWFAYKLFAFLKEKDTPTNTLDTESVFVEQPENDPDEDEEEESNQSEPVVPSGNQSTATASPALTSSQNRFVPPQPKKRRTAIDDPRLAQAYKIMDNATKTTRDEFSTFGEHIATKLRKFDDRNRNYLMHKISTLIYETEIEVDTVYTRSPMQQSGESSASRMSTPSPSPQLPLPTTLYKHL